MSEYTFETAALKAVTIDAVKYNEEGLKNSLTPEAIQQVVPIAWNKKAATLALGWNNICTTNSVTIGDNAKGEGSINVAVGNYSHAKGAWSSAFGHLAQAYGGCSLALGKNTTSSGTGTISIGYETIGSSATTVTIGCQFDETVNGQKVTNYCKTEGTGSITIGAGANTLNNGDAESSNSVTIGCKALNEGADSVVIGAGAKTTYPYATIIGTKASGMGTAMGYNAQSHYGGVAIGRGSFSNTGTSVGNYSYNYGHAANAFGDSARASAQHSTALGYNTKASGFGSTAIGSGAKSNDKGTVVFRSTAEDGTYTQLYFSGANTPLANKYFPTAWEQKQDVDEQGNPKVDENGDPVMVDDKDKPIAGEAMMGFVAKDKDGNIIARGANMLSALFPYYTGAEDDPFAPTTMSLGGEKPEPVAFHPSDLDMPQEELTIPEMEEYTPLPVYPIVEPEIEEINE